MLNEEQQQALMQYLLDALEENECSKEYLFGYDLSDDEVTENRISLYCNNNHDDTFDGGEAAGSYDLAYSILQTFFPDALGELDND